jgi:hypothetical protein
MPDLSLPLSANFTLGEFLRSETAERDEHLKAEQEHPPDEILFNLKYLTETALQPIRSLLGFPVRITSGYRCQLLNKLVGGSATSQHCRGEAADCRLSPRFLQDETVQGVREEVAARVKEITGSPLRPEVGPSFYLFAHVCLHLDELDVDQVIHEYGGGFGRPAWVHISTSRRQDKRQILAVGSYTNRAYLRPSLEEALRFGT